METELDFARRKYMKRKDSVLVFKELGEENYSQLLSILAMEPHLRTAGHISLLSSFAKNFKFFADIRNSVSESALIQCCRALKLAHFSAGSFVFTQGEVGSQFFIILSGSCGIIQSTPKQRSRLLQILRPGDCFGELALIANKTRAASVLCREDAHFAVLDKDDYKRILAEIQGQSMTEKVETIKKYPVFGKFSEEGMRQLTYLFKSWTLKATQTLFQLGQIANEVFLVKSGRFRLVKLGHNVVKKQKVWVNVGGVEAGELLGGLEAMEDDAFDGNCVCESETGEVLRISKDKLRLVLTEEKKMNAFLLYERENMRRIPSIPQIDPGKRLEKTHIPAISDGFYQRLVLKHPSKWKSPIIYKPLKLMPEKKSSLPELDRKALHLSLLGTVDLESSTESPVTVTSKLVIRPKRQVFYYGTKPRFVGESLLVNSHLAK